MLTCITGSNATLSLIGTPSIDFFDRVELVAVALVMALLVAAMCMGVMMSYLLLLSFYGNCISRTPGCVTGDCYRCMPQSCCSNRRKCVRLTINGICSTISSTLLIFVTVFTFAGGMRVLKDLGKTDMKPLSFLLCSLLHLAHVAELITTDCMMFRPCRPLSTMYYVQT